MATPTTSATPFTPHFEHRIRGAIAANVAAGPAILASATGSHADSRRSRT